jgi:hypothetical protein
MGHPALVQRAVKGFAPGYIGPAGREEMTGAGARRYFEVFVVPGQIAVGRMDAGRVAAALGGGGVEGGRGLGPVWWR